MDVELGIIFAFAAMLCWGFGDFLIQRFARKIGDWESLLSISIVGAIIIFPFIYKELPDLFSNTKGLVILILASVVMLLAALLDFEALKKGKISVSEPIFALEIPVSLSLAFIILSEGIKVEQALLIVGLVIGLVLVSLKTYHFNKKVWLEKGVILAVLGALFMGVTNFLFGFGARETSALIINWFTSVFLVIACLLYLLFSKRFRNFIKDVQKDKKLLLSMCLLDNIAWVAFAYAMVIAPIAIAVALSESYIVIAVLL
jgi:drug/metabolite transporter (DMT)-like permease